MVTCIIPITYAAAGILVPLFYIPQVRSCLRDTSGLCAFSVSKCVVHMVLRATMLPFIVMTANHLVVLASVLDFLGRTTELTAAVASLRRQGWAWGDIAGRMRPRVLARF